MRIAGFLLLFSLTSCAGLTDRGVVDQFGQPAPLTPKAQAYAHYLNAILLERQAKQEDAAREMRIATDLDPSAVTPTLRLIQSYLRNEDYQNALVMCQRALNQLPEQPVLWILLGEIHHHFEHYEEAQKAFEKAIALDPDSLLGQDRLLAFEESTNDLVAAADIYQRILTQRPDDPGLNFQLGLNLARMGDHEGARAALEKAIQLKPALYRARFVLGVVYLEMGENALARDQFAEVVKHEPDDLRAQSNYVGTLGRLGQYDDAIAAVSALRAANPADAKTAIEMAYLLLRAKRYQELNDMPPPQGALIYGALFNALARAQLGLPYQNIVQSLDDIESDLDAESQEYLNDILFLFGAEDTGNFLLEALQRFIGEGISSRTLETLYGRILVGLERYPDAERALSSTLTKYGPDKNLHYYLASCYEKLEQFGPAEEHLKAYLKLVPDDPDVINFLAYLYAVHNVKLDEAEKLLLRALELDPGNGFYLDSLGWVYYRQGNADRAIECIRKALVALDNDDAEVRDHLGDAYMLKGDPAQAVAQWERALRLDPKYEGVQEKIDKVKKP